MCEAYLQHLHMPPHIFDTAKTMTRIGHAMFTVSAVNTFKFPSKNVRPNNKMIIDFILWCGHLHIISFP